MITSNKSFKTDKIITNVLNIYKNFVKVFFLDLSAQILEYIKIQNYEILFVYYQQLTYNYFQNLRLVKLEMLKTYIKIKLVNNFIKLFKFLAIGSNIFVKKHAKSL